MSYGKTSNKVDEEKYKVVEISLISAYDLDPPSTKDLEIRAVMWLDPKRKVESSVVAGTTEPEWGANETFVFVVEAKALNRLTTAALVVELYAGHLLLGTSRPLLGRIPGCGRHYAGNTIGAVMDYHLRRPDTLIRGVLKLGFTVLHGLPLTDDKLLATGLAVDCNTMILNKSSSSRGAAFVRRFADTVIKGFLRPLKIY